MTKCCDRSNDCCANQAAGESAECADGWVPSTQPQSYDDCPNYTCLPPPSCSLDFDGGTTVLIGCTIPDEVEYNADLPPHTNTVLYAVSLGLLRRCRGATITWFCLCAP